ncbi:auxin-induced in root cultures protein 12-like [Rutidosis leptorrhynchoides]|uniref:auxin-induced in root cultures protein 12-like n=1 Tax=Rutidosis leptorrhynchoides TaxID=125765 RepID=UPI003A996C08
MAFHHREPPFSVILIIITSILFLTSPSHSLTCTSQKFTSNNLYTNCTDLPTLGSSLHYTHDAKTSLLKIAFVAPSKPTGWIAWAINPTQTGMAGSQALLAFQNANGSMNVKTYNISSYSSIVEGKILFDVTDLTAEYSAGSMKIFATVKLPEKMTTLNQVWQVGSSVTAGVPGKHEFKPENLKATGKLLLQVTEKAKSNVTGGSSAPVGNPVASPIGSSVTNAPSPTTSDGYRNNIMYVFVVLLIGALIYS